MKLRCLVIEDEPLAQNILKKYITKLKSLELAGITDNALEALAYLHNHSVDVIFLDIKMPELSGLDFLKTLDTSPQIIITSAFAEYAIDGYEFSVADFLLKPFSFSRFLKAVNKLKKAKPDETPHAGGENGFLFLKVDRTLRKVFFSQIKFIQGFGNYLKVFLENNWLLVPERLHEMEKLLPAGSFLRTHKSYIVSKKWIERIEENQIVIDDRRIPIGNTYKKSVMAMILPEEKS